MNPKYIKIRSSGMVRCANCYRDPPVDFIRIDGKKDILSDSFGYELTSARSFRKFSKFLHKRGSILEKIDLQSMKIDERTLQNFHSEFNKVEEFIQRKQTDIRNFQQNILNGFEILSTLIIQTSNLAENVGTTESQFKEMARQIQDGLNHGRKKQNP